LNLPEFIEGAFSLIAQSISNIDIYIGITLPPLLNSFPPFTMLHEILFALVGKTGSLIKDSGDRYLVDAKIDFINRAEKELISSIA
jgi:hypothetical protein